jgi:hypothetical protein
MKPLLIIKQDAVKAHNPRHNNFIDFLTVVIQKHLVLNGQVCIRLKQLYRLRGIPIILFLVIPRLYRGMQILAFLDSRFCENDL